MLVPIACRFVPYDQWFITHLDDGYKVKQVKHTILSRCNLLSPAPGTRRSVSPIIFASGVRSSASLDSLDDGYDEDGEHSDQDLPSKPVIYSRPNEKPRTSSQAAQSGSPLVDRYTLISFSTGSILEDEFALSWYNLCAYELLEMHPVGTVIPLQRDILAEYVQPYFQAKVRVLRVVWNRRSDHFEAPGIDIQRDHGGSKDSLSPKSDSFQSDRRRKTKVNWKTRWVVINQGFLSLCKDHVTGPPVHHFALNNMTALRDADGLSRAFSIAIQPRVVCIKFRPQPASPAGAASPPPSSTSSPISEDSRSNAHEALLPVDPVSDSGRTMEQEESGESIYGRSKGEWVVLDMLDDHAFSSILRVLHREAPHGLSTSFAPTSPVMADSPYSSMATSYDTIPYPEWRIHTVENARKAGMGDIGKPMAWVLWTDKGLGETLLDNIRQHRQAFSQEMQYKNSSIPFELYGPDDESEDESEVEWEGWIRDLERQNQIKQRSEKVNRSCAFGRAHTPSLQLPSPPVSEASPTGSPRDRSPPLTGSFAPHSRGPYPNIGNVIGGYGYHNIEVRKTTVSTVTAGMTSPSRRRSSTVSTGPMTAKLDRGKQVRERLSSLTLNSRASVRAVCASVGVPVSPSTPVRHAHSSSNLRRTLYGSDAAESPTHPVPSSPTKRQGAFMRGMTLRAGKIVRGLESAIDFVDDKTSND